MNQQTHQTMSVGKMHLLYFAVVFLFGIYNIHAQAAQDSTVNNLVHPAGYKTSPYGKLGNIQKSGSGKHAMILIPGWGFDASVFNDFREANKSQYTMYTITIPATVPPWLPLCLRIVPATVSKLGIRGYLRA